MSGELARQVEGVREIDAHVVVRRRDRARKEVVRRREKDRIAEAVDDEFRPEEPELAAGAVFDAAVIVARAEQELIGQTEQRRLLHRLQGSAEAVCVLARAIDRAEVLGIDAEVRKKDRIAVLILGRFLLETELARRPADRAAVDRFDDIAVDVLLLELAIVGDTRDR